LYGVEPFNSGLYPFYEHAIHKQLMERYISLPRFLRENGYQTFGAGKVHHGSTEDSREWTEYFKTKAATKIFKENLGYQIGESKKMSFRPTFHSDEEHIDHQVASYGIDVLKKKHDKPFFLAVGIVKPHLPFDCPVRFFDALPDSIEAPAILENDLIDIPTEGNKFRRPGDDRKFKKDKAWEDVRRAYLACISWADYNIGRVLDELEKSPYADNTIVVVWSDHGYHLGEKMSFRKFTLWEEATRVPFIICDGRNATDKSGQDCKQSVSLINIYKTLAEMAGLSAPEYVDGESLVQQLKNPDQLLLQPAITSWGRGNYAVRSQNWRYIKYFDGTEELYSHEKDPNEWHNLAKEPEFEAKKKEFSKFLPESEAPTIEDYISPWSIEGADRKRLKDKSSLNKNL
jgi:arylsulfatase A-like enzyme